MNKNASFLLKFTRTHINLISVTCVTSILFSLAICFIGKSHAAVNSAITVGKGSHAVAGGIMIDGSYISPATVQDAGILKKEKRVLPDFNQIDLNGFAGKVRIRHGKENIVFVSADSSVISAVKTKVEGNVLKIGVKKTISTTKPLQIDIYAKYFSSVSASGITGVIIEYINNTEKLYVDVSGAASIFAKGKVNKIYLVVSGNGRLQFQGLLSEECDISISGIGRAFVNARKKLTAKVSGAGHVTYSGNPLVFKNIQGVGRVEPAE